MIKKVQAIDRRLLTVLLIVFVQMLGAAMILPILPLYAQREFGMAPQTITLLATTFFAAQFVAGPFLGRLSDKIGRRPVLLVSQAGTAVSFLMLALAPNVAFLFLARLLDGITGGNVIVAQAYITDITPREKRTQSLGYIFAVFGLGFIFGPALGGLLAAAFGPRIPYVFAAIAATIVVLLTWFTLDESLTQEQRLANRAFKRRSIGLSAILGNRVLFLILIIAFIGQFGFGMLQATFALFGAAVLFADFSESMVNLGIGVLLTLVGVGQVTTQVWLLPQALKRFDETRLVIFGLLSRATGLLIFAVLAKPLLGGVAALLFAAGIGLMMPSLQSLTTSAVADEVRGGVLGVYQSTVSLAIIFSTAVAGTIFALDPTYPYWVGAGLSLLVLLPALLLVRWMGNGRSHPAALSATD
jgi:MFS transporter, DHA1 family, tetracycline resistance protein